ncbi:Glycerol-3-phosphate dehydrogenase (NAD(P)+) [Staphylococcus aureus]|nr:Glycerol-3-phosphate dehydrogenase (NAD(P)+) [Staphylococcus aureus]
MTKITVFGMGSFGTALANVLAENGHDVLMWGKNQDAVDELNTCHTNKKYLKYAKLDVNIHRYFRYDQSNSICRYLLNGFTY